MKRRARIRPEKPPAEQAIERRMARLRDALRATIKAQDLADRRSKRKRGEDAPGHG